ncbi:hypothetical protein BJ508DRAFT_417360 [Ascobolus immersus RN42]|uniref:Fungal calcium binding protein domain-containing protein n=1 Tax=Ascobolus immersus RN42 TaxID=1160509 RepID=A0A3N4I501_ASCIM|nr:hypothetical protein BJ508DRAFT_417360 [Ascobolus immersus RN42]
MRPQIIFTTFLTLASFAAVSLSAPTAFPSSESTQSLIAKDLADKIAAVLQISPAKAQRLLDIPQAESKTAGAVDPFDDDDKSACGGLFKFVCKIFSSKPKPNNNNIQLRPDIQPGMGITTTITGGGRK